MPSAETTSYNATTRDQNGVTLRAGALFRFGLIADAEIRISHKRPAVSRLSDVLGAGGLALCWEGRRGRPRYAGQPTGVWLYEDLRVDHGNDARQMGKGQGTN
jgi:hypothetical protein